jgi:hypothetical protein
MKKSQGAKSREYGGWGNDSYFVFRQKLLDKDGSVRRGVVMVKISRSVLAKVWGYVRILGTNLAATRFMSNSSVRTRWHVP